MRFLGRIVLLLVGLIFAIPAGTVALAIGIAAEPAARELTALIGIAVMNAVFDDAFRGVEPDLIGLQLFYGFGAISLVVLIAPVSLVAIVGEVIRNASFVFYAGVTGLLTAGIPWVLRGGVTTSGAALAAEGRITALLFVTGAVAGLVYWLVAGRGAGRKRAPEGVR